MTEIILADARLTPELALKTLEEGGVIHLPQKSFEIFPPEAELLFHTTMQGKRKNISYVPHNKQVRGADLSPGQTDLYQHLLKRFQAEATQLIKTLCPEYAPHLILGRTSFRPTEIQGRKTSYKKDDRRLHVDAFSATPLQGKRILRVFTNIHPGGKPRSWLLGESFSAVAQRFLSQISPYRPLIAQCLHQLRLTKTYRSEYDHMMLGLHNAMKYDQDYQKTVSKTAIDFPAGSTWITFTDATSHAALSGCHLLEQTFYLLPEHMKNPHCSPLFILERLVNRPLLKTHRLI